MLDLRSSNAASTTSEASLAQLEVTGVRPISG